MSALRVANETMRHALLVLSLSSAEKTVSLPISAIDKIGDSRSADFPCIRVVPTPSLQKERYAEQVEETHL